MTTTAIGRATLEAARDLIYSFAQQCGAAVAPPWRVASVLRSLERALEQSERPGEDQECDRQAEQPAAEPVARKECHECHIPGGCGVGQCSIGCFASTAQQPVEPTDLIVYAPASVKQLTKQRDELLEALQGAPALSAYHSHHGFMVERFIGAYEAWRERAHAVIAKVTGEQR